MKTIYTVYQLNEKRNKLGNPYIGMTYNTLQRSKQWKSKLKLDYIPELITLHTETDGQRCFNWEQNKKVELGWPREKSYRSQKVMRKNLSLLNKNKEHQINAAKIAGKKAVDSGQLAAMRTKESIHKGAKTTASIERICPHCNKTTKSNTYFMNHGDRCKLKPQLHLESRPI
jgi:hypothetical protein